MQCHIFRKIFPVGSPSMEGEAPAMVFLVILVDYEIESLPSFFLFFFLFPFNSF